MSSDIWKLASSIQPIRYAIVHSLYKEVLMTTVCNSKVLARLVQIMSDFHNLTINKDGWMFDQHGDAYAFFDHPVHTSNVYQVKAYANTNGEYTSYSLYRVLASGMI